MEQLMQLEGDLKMMDAFIGQCDATINARQLKYIGSAAKWKMHFEGEKKKVSRQLERLRTNHGKSPTKLAA